MEVGRNRHRTIAVGAAAVLAVLLATATLSAQRSERAFSAPLEVVLVNLDLVALDGDGRPVVDLTADEFTVLEDGREVDLTHFAGPLAAGGASRGPVNLVLLLDEARLDPSGRRAALEHLRRLLADPPDTDPRAFDEARGGSAPVRGSLDDLRGSFAAPRDTGLQVMVLAMNPGLEIVQPLTGDLAAVDRSLAELVGRRMASPDAQERARLLREMQVAAGEVSTQGQVSQYGRPAPRSARPLEASDYASTVAQTFLHQIQDYARTAGDRQRVAFEVVGRLLRSLSGLDGRTALLVVSDGLATSPGEPLVRAWEQLFHNIIQSIAIQPRATLFEVDATDAVREMVRLATAHRVTVFELRAGAGRELEAVQAEVKGLAFGSGFASGGSFGDAPTLALVAAATGGRSLAVEARNLDRELASVVREMALGYSLGYLPPSPGDGGYHTLRVEIARPGVTPRHREGYLAAPDADALVDRTLAAAVLGVADDPLDLELATGAPSPRDDGRLVLPLTVSIPLRRLGLAAHGAAHEGRVVIALAVRGEDGRVRGLERREFPVAIANSEFPGALGRSVEVLFNLVVEPGELRIGIGVHDAYGEVSATSVVDVDVAAAAG